MADARRERLTHDLDVPAVLRQQVREVHRQLDEGLTDWLRALSPATPPTGSRVVALYNHAATVEDVTVQALLRHVAPIYETDWAGRGPGHYSTNNLVPLRAYAQQVFATTDAYLAGLNADEPRQELDLSRLGQGRPTIAWVVSKFVVLQLAQIYGELLSAARGT
jgi:hypothetical protein